MKNLIALLIFLLLSFKGYSQITFEEGYFITNSGERVNCLIKNLDWKNNPTDFKYKLTETSDLKNVGINDVKIFVINDKIKYQRFSVNIERSGTTINSLTFNKNPEFNKEQLFLKVLLEGKASLYQYEQGNIIKYFYRMDSSDVEQLVYTRYKVSDSEIKANERFKQQLWTSLNCENLPLGYFENVNYDRNQLIKLFTKYNECTGSEFITYKTKSTKNWINLSLRPGIHYSSLSIYHIPNGNHISFSNMDFGYGLGYRFGIEAEFVLPFNKNKWAILFEPTYNIYKSESNSGDIEAYVDYKSVEIPLGIRHYFFIDPKNKIFINGSAVIDFAINSHLEYFRSAVSLNIKSGVNFTYGAGYNYNNKFSVEIRHQLNREILYSHTNWESDYSGFAFVLGYTIL